MRALDHHLLVRGDSALKFHFDDRSSDGFGLRLPAEGTPRQPLGPGDYKLICPTGQPFSLPWQKIIRFAATPNQQ